MNLKNQSPGRTPTKPTASFWIGFTEQKLVVMVCWKSTFLSCTQLIGFNVELISCTIHAVTLIDVFWYQGYVKDGEMIGWKRGCSSMFFCIHQVIVHSLYLHGHFDALSPTEVPSMCQLEERVLTHSGGDWNDIISLELLLEILRMDKLQAAPALVEVLVISLHFGSYAHLSGQYKIHTRTCREVSCISMYHLAGAWTHKGCLFSNNCRNVKGVLFQQEECVEVCCNAYEKHWWLHGAVGTTDSKQQVWFVTCITAKHSPNPINSVSCHPFQLELCLFNTGMFHLSQEVNSNAHAFVDHNFERLQLLDLLQDKDFQQELLQYSSLAVREEPWGKSAKSMASGLTKIARKEAFEAIWCEKVIRTSRAVCVFEVWAVCQKYRLSALVGRRRWTAWNEAKISILHQPSDRQQSQTATLPEQGPSGSCKVVDGFEFVILFALIPGIGKLSCGMWNERWRP